MSAHVCRGAFGAQAFGAQEMKAHLRFGLIFSAACLGAIYLHEIGHAVAGWLQGIAVVPTPAKEYVLQSEVEWSQQIWISFGGVAATLLLTLGTLLWYAFKRVPRAWSDAAVAGVFLPAGLYTLRFLIVGRGHDAWEWQATQAALGVDPAGHLIDFLFLLLSLAGIVAAAIRGRAALRLASIPKIAGLAFAGLVLVILIQVTNNALFDRVFPRTTTVNVPTELDAR
jgi:hypothetical protein